MKLIVAAVLATVTSGSALAQPAATPEALPAAPESSPDALAPTAPPPGALPPGAPQAAPVRTRPLPTARALTEPALAPPALAWTRRTAPVRTVYEWYGWKVLLADGATLGLALAINNGEAALGWVGAGALVHAAQGNYGRALASLTLRVVLPFLGGTAGEASASGCTGDWCDLGPAVGGALVGAAVAEVIDLAMATERHEIAPPKTSASWAPVASVRHSGATFGIAARF